MSNLLVYHSQKCQKILSALSIKVITPQIDILCASKEVDIDQVHMMGMGGEIKVDDAKEDAENECFYNMFA